MISSWFSFFLPTKAYCTDIVPFVCISLTKMYRFAVYPRPRTARREQLAFKIKSILKGTEWEGKQIQYINSIDLMIRYSIQTGACGLASTANHWTKADWRVDIWCSNIVRGTSGCYPKQRCPFITTCAIATSDWCEEAVKASEAIIPG